MKTILLMRHAKSSWNSAAKTDHDRPLNKRGYRDSPKVAKHLEKLGLLPELVISSTSMRTRETWEHMQQALEPIIPVQFCKSLYHGSLSDIRTQVIAMGNPYDRILVLGHNPGWEYAASKLSGSYLEMTTANVVILTTNQDSWDQAFSQSTDWKLVEHIQPRKL